MPEAAVGTGCVDFVLAPESIATELRRIGVATSVLVSKADDEAVFLRIVRALQRASGIDFASYKQSTIRRRVVRRVLVHGLTTLGEYADLLERSREEASALTAEVLIHVTGFFRDPEVFEVLKSVVFPKLLENRPRDVTIRVWVPGCSTGEEVYSIAIALAEYLTDVNATDLPIKLFGTDVSLATIEKARAAKYPSSIAREVSQGRLQRFFTKTETGYQIRKDLRDLCVFAKQDATRDPPFSAMDIISCRNLMIYLGPALQERLLPIFHYALKEPGFLVLGTSETIRSFPGFATFDAKNKIYARTSAAPRLLFDFTERRISEPLEPTTHGATKVSGPQDVHREADRLVLAEFAPPGVVITDDLAIVQFRGKTGLYLEPTPGTASFDLLRMVHEELRIPLRQTIDEARSKLKPTRKVGLAFGAADTRRVVDLEVIPFRAASSPQRFFVVLFKEVPTVDVEGVAEKPPPPPPDPQQASVESQLTQELASTRDYLQAVIEQVEASNEELKAANEEIVSSNEELRSTNEELQMAKEELQATNEELRTVNDEMLVRNAEGTRLNDDLTNVLSSVEIPIVILGRDSRLRRYTSAAAKVFGLSPTDLGRPLGEIRPGGYTAEIVPMITEVLEHLGAMERTMRDDTGRWYQVAVRPYLTVDNRIDGTVITAIDIDNVKRGEQLLVEARTYAESIVDTVRECLVVLDLELRVVSANRAFLETLGRVSKEVVGLRLEDLGSGEWALASLREGLERLREGVAFDGMRVAGEFAGVGKRVFVLHARRIAGTALILLALEDVTEKERVEAALQKSESGFRDMLMSAAEAIVMADASGKIVFGNEAAAKAFGYGEDELRGLDIDALVPKGQRGAHAKHRVEFLAEPTPRSMARDRILSGVRKDGTEFPVEVLLGSMMSAGGPLAVAFVSDVSRRRETEQKLREYQDKLQRVVFDSALLEERERRRIAVDLHDRIGQSLALAQIKLGSIRGEVTGAPRKAIDDAIEQIVQSIGDTRSLTFELSPPVLYDLGLKEALSWLVEDIEKRYGLHIEIVDDGLDKPLDQGASALVFRAVRELLMNVFKHAGSAHATVSLRRTGDHFDIEVVDEGSGFSPDEEGARESGGGFGLFSVREQIRRLGGTVTIVSAPQEGTRVSVLVPLLNPALETDARS